MDDTRIALAPFLLFCPSVITLGILPAFEDYSLEAKRLLRRAHRVFFPTPRYAGLLQAVGIPTFPRATTYHYQRSNILQTNLFQYLKWPHPHTRIYFGMRQKQNICKDFVFPFWGMGRHVSATPPHSIADLETLKRLSNLYNPLIIQKRVRWIDRVKLICVQFECVGALQRKGDDAGLGAFEPIPPGHSSLTEITKATHRLLRLAQLDDICVEWGYGQYQWQVIGLKRPPLRWDTPQGAGHRHRLICQLIQDGRL